MIIFVETKDYETKFISGPRLLASREDILGSRSGEHYHEVAAVITLVAVNITHTEFSVIGAEDIGGMWSAVHPPVKRTLWVLRHHVIFTNP